MALFRKRKTGQQLTNANGAVVVELGEHEVIPDRLRVAITRHELDFLPQPVTCWRYRSTGLAKVGQREVVLWVQLGPNELPEQPLAEPLDYFPLLHKLATDGHVVDRYDCSIFGDRGLLGSGGIVYAPAWSPVAGRDSDLVAVLLTIDEAQVAYRLNPTRVLARLGEATRYYPFPFWNVRGRTPVAAPDETTVLVNSPAMHLRGATVVQRGGRVTLELPRTDAADVARQMELLPPGVIGSRTAFSRTATAHLVWRPGQPAATAISAGGTDYTIPVTDADTVVAGSFLLAVGDQEAVSAKIAEDGYAVFLTPDAFDTVRLALFTGRDASVDADRVAPGGPSGFAVQWQG